MYWAIQISKLNDFIFCPYSIYFHGIYESFSESTYHQAPQIIGKIAHEKIDTKKYSTKKNTIQAQYIFSNVYYLVGKIDIFEIDTGHLIERKHKIKKIYDGYILQLYSQMFCLEEQGYKVKKISLHSLSDNKRYPIDLPDSFDRNYYSNLLRKIQNFDILDPFNEELHISPGKCKKCIYSNLCSFSQC